MQLDVSLNGPFNYAFYPLIIVLLLFIATIILFLCFNIKIKKKEKIVIVQPKNMNDIKNQYLKELEELANSISNLTKRKVYNKLSLIIRSFVLEATNIDVLKYSLSEIKQLKMDSLTELVKEYYEPEFSKESNADPITSINKTKEVINQWK